MPKTPYDYLVKVVVVGDSNVGKSCLVRRFTEDRYDDENNATVGVDFKLTTIEAAGSVVRLTVWDTAGQERFRALTPSYYRNAQGVIYIYDVSRRESFEKLDHWIAELEAVRPNAGLVKILVGNKVDLDRDVSRVEAKAFAERHSMHFLEASAKSAIGVRDVFQDVVDQVLDTPALLATTLPGPSSLKVSQQSDERGLCC